MTSIGRRALIAWSTCALALLVTAVGVALWIATWSVPAPASLTPRGFVLVLAPLFAVVGALVTARAPGNGIGYVFLYMGLGGAVQLLSEQVAFAAQQWPQLLGIAPWAATLFFAFGMTNSFITALYVVALFPGGRFATSSERNVVVIGTVAYAAFALLTILSIDRLPAPFNGYGLPFRRLEPSLNAYAAGFATLSGYLAALAVVTRGLVRRFRRSRGTERQQFKWFAYASGFLTLTLMVQWSSLVVGIFAFGFQSVLDNPPDEIRAITAVNIAAYATVPLAIGFAIFRYRLYDIDVLINRTLVYSAVSATLALIYVTAVVGLQALLRPIAGQSEFAVAGSTLLVVALFQPIRLRVQNLVDHRFYRGRYDASRAIDAFAARLRSEVELDSVRADLIGVVHDTMHPAHASVWLRSGR